MVSKISCMIDGKVEKIDPHEVSAFVGAGASNSLSGMLALAVNSEMNSIVWHASRSVNGVMVGPTCLSAGVAIEGLTEEDHNLIGKINDCDFSGLIPTAKDLRNNAAMIGYHWQSICYLRKGPNFYTVELTLLDEIRRLELVVKKCLSHINGNGNIL